MKIDTMVRALFAMSFLLGGCAAETGPSDPAPTPGAERMPEPQTGEHPQYGPMECYRDCRGFNASEDAFCACACGLGACGEY